MINPTDATVSLQTDDKRPIGREDKDQITDQTPKKSMTTGVQKVSLNSAASFLPESSVRL
jgi:hypothetical protein